jgi:hypothetical protein
MIIFERYMIRLSVIFCVFISLNVWGSTWLTRVNLTDSLLVYSEGKLQRTDAPTRQKYSTVYFTLRADRYHGDYLVVESQKPVHMFIEGRLYFPGLRSLRLKSDSLRVLAGKDYFWIALHQRGGIGKDLSVRIESLTEFEIPDADTGIHSIVQDGYRDFLLMAIAIIVLICAWLFRINRLLVAGYFNPRSFFTWNENDDHPMYNRALHTANILMFLLALFILAVLLTVPQGGTTTFRDLWRQSVLHVFQAGIFMIAKAMAVIVFSAFFNIRHLRAFHYIGFIRFVVWICSALLVVQIMRIFVFTSHPVNIGTTWILSLLAIWGVQVTGKLYHHTRFKWIHLFSYLCATEIAPLLLVTAVY